MWYVTTGGYSFAEDSDSMHSPGKLRHGYFFGCTATTIVAGSGSSALAQRDRGDTNHQRKTTGQPHRTSKQGTVRL